MILSLHSERATNMTEEWKGIPGYEGLYQASNLGKIRSLPRLVSVKDGRIRRCSGRVLSPSTVVGGYQSATLCDERGQRTFRVHRLVAMAFLPNPENLPEINHKDRNTSNNCVDNLEWCTRLYNARYDGGVERRAAAYNKPIRQLTMDGRVVKEYISAKDASTQTGIGRTGISRAARGVMHQAGGFKWQYMDKPTKRYERKHILSTM